MSLFSFHTDVREAKRKRASTRGVSKTLAALACVALGAGATVAHAQQASPYVFQDEFNSGAIDGSAWDFYDATHALQRTQFGTAPTVGADADGTRYARVRLDTFNPDRSKSDMLRSTEMFSRRLFSLPPTGGLQMEARMRCADLPRGLVGAFYTYGYRGVWPDTYYSDEIDFELLTNFASNQAWLNIWNDWNPAGKNPNSSRATQTTIAGYNRSQWTTYTIRWYRNRVQWIVNGVVARTETSIVPDDPQALRFNLWAASSGWSTAYDANLQPASSAAANRSYDMDIDYVRVAPIDDNGNPVNPNPTPSPAPTPSPQPTGPVVGNGNGLRADYFDDSNFTGTTSTRIDRQINFNWGSGAPVSGFGADTFSARWTGEVQAQYSQTYTFYARADDGVRVWVNNQLLIDAWKDQGPTEYSKTIALKAGTRYPIKVEYYENIGGAVMQLSWSSLSTSKQIVPATQLYAASIPNPTPTPTASPTPKPTPSPKPTASPTPKPTPTQSPSDTTPPQISVASPHEGWSYNMPPQADGTASDNAAVSGVTVTLQRASDKKYWNNGKWKPQAADLPAIGTTNWTWAMPKLSDGIYNFSATARDGSGNVRTSPTITFYVDKTAPKVKIVTPKKGAKTAAQATGTATDKLAGIALVTLRLQRVDNGQYWTGGAWSSEVSDFSASGTDNWSASLPALSPGGYKLSARARDWAGNWGASPNVSLKIK